MYWPSCLFLSHTSSWKSWILLWSPQSPPWSSLPDTPPHTHTPICGQGIVFCWRGRCGSSTGGCWPQTSTMTSWSPPWGSWPTLSNWWWWVHLSLICTYHTKLNPQFTLKQIYPSNIQQTQPPRIMPSIPETHTLHTRSVQKHCHVLKLPYTAKPVPSCRHMDTLLPIWHTPQHTCATAV